MGSAEASMSAEENKELVRRYLAAVDRRDEATLDAVLAPEYRYHVPGQPAPLDRAGLRAFVAAFQAAFPDLTHTVEDQVAEGDRVATRSTNRGTHRGELMGMPPTGRRFAGAGINVVRIVDGRIAEEWVVFDALGMLQQLGVFPAPESGTG
jgi:steroid delta-isomerase-like uncharacterized protein